MKDIGSQSPTVTRGRKFDQVIAGATEVFLRDGYAAASVDEIAKVSGVSKATLYSYFPDKRAMFSEMVHAECERRTAEAMSHINFDAPFAEILHQAGMEIIRIDTSEVGIAYFRLVIAETARFPELGPIFFENGLGHLEQQFMPVLESYIQDGVLRPHDTRLSTHQFYALTQAEVVPKVTMGLIPVPSCADMRRIVDGAVQMFMATYGVET